MKILSALLLVALAPFGYSQTLPNATPMPSAVYQFLDPNGAPLAGGKLYTCVAGFTCPGSNAQATYTDSTAGTQNANPIVLDSAGRAQIWLGPQPYRLTLQDANGVQQWTQDNVFDTALYFVNYVKTIGTATLISYVDPITGGVSRTVTSRLSDRADAKDFGVVCDGSTDDTTALQLAVTNAATAKAALYLPADTCLVSALSLPSNTHIIGQGWGLSTIKQKALTGVNNTPFLTNSDHTGGNSNIALEQLTIDGNASNQGGVSEVTGLQLFQVDTVRVDFAQFINIIGWGISGANWTNITVSNSRFSNYASNSTTLKNSACIGTRYADATAASKNIHLFSNFCDGSATGVGGFKLSGTVAAPISGIIETDNHWIVGDSGTSDTALGSELYSNDGPTTFDGFFDFIVDHNIVEGVSASSPLGNQTFGISICGSGGNHGTVSHNTIKWIGDFSIELCGPNISAVGNTLDTTAQVIVNSSFGGTIENVSVTDTVFKNPTGYNSGTPGAPAFLAYTQSGGILRNISFRGNQVDYTNTAAPSPTNSVIHAQCNSGSGSILDTNITDNQIHGPGTAYSVTGITLEQDGTCSVSRSIISRNTLVNLTNGIFYGGDDNTQTTYNTYSNVTARHAASGSIPVSDVFWEIDPSADYTTAWSSISPSSNIILTKTGQYFQTNNGATTPNIITWNATNGGDCAIGGVFSTNSRQNLSSDMVPYGWTQTSSGAYTRAAYYQNGACRFVIAFGPATGAGPNPPADNNVFVAEDTSSNSGGVTSGGIGIGSAGITSGSRIQQFWKASGSWTPGAIANNGIAATTLSVAGCAAGDLTVADFDGISALQFSSSSKAVTDGVAILIQNLTGGSSSPTGTVKVGCFHTN